MKMSEAGQEVCILTARGPCASTAGAARPAAAVPPARAVRLRKERRETDVASASVIVSSIGSRPSGECEQSINNRQVLLQKLLPADRKRPPACAFL